MTGRKLKKSLDFANRQGIPYVVIIGENELSAGKARIKEMGSGNEYEMDLVSLAAAAEQIILGRK